MNELVKIPPSAEDLEKAVLGALMLEKNRLIDVSNIVSKDSFYFEKHRIIFETIQKIDRANNPIDLLTVSEKLRESGTLENIGGVYYLTQLTSNVVSAANIEYHASIIQQKFLQRELIRICSETEAKAYDSLSDIDDLFSYIENEIIRLNIVKNLDCKTFNENVKESINSAIARKNRNIEITGQNTGSKQMNALTGGWQDGDFILIGARPSMGKTAMSLHYALQAAKEKHVLYFSLEMSVRKITDRAVTGYLNINPESYKTGQFENEYVNVLYESELELGAHKLHIYDDKFKVSEIIAVSRQKKLKKECDIIFIDYLGLIDPGNRYKGNKVNEIGEISRQIKQLASKLKVPIIALHQLNRDVEKRADHTPVLSDLRDTGNLEQDADLVIFLYREDYYNRLNPEYERNYQIDNIIAKHRDGRIGMITYKHNKYINKFFENENEIQENDIPF
ncbi:MAG: replicative DNA helicase [Candidatus Lokiarchaeota archaeon]|nr:replicative DNA helicase [Candidatus Lokiarchaeota archaeon]